MSFDCASVSEIYPAVVTCHASLSLSLSQMTSTVSLLLGHTTAATGYAAGCAAC